MLTDDEVLRLAIQCQLLTTNNRSGYHAQALLDFAKLIQQATLNTK